MILWTLHEIVTVDKKYIIQIQTVQWDNLIRVWSLLGQKVTHFSTAIYLYCVLNYTSVHVFAQKSNVIVWGHHKRETVINSTTLWNTAMVTVELKSSRKIYCSQLFYLFHFLKEESHCSLKWQLTVLKREFN